ncbi:MAG: TIGR04295 family B12-binding domain-containing radical SAM protein [Desulfovibrionales bacterium]
MRFALVNPNWSYEGSIYFGCKEPHLPLELGYSKSLLEQQGHDVLLLDGHLFDCTVTDLTRTVASFKPDFTVICTAPTYLFWRCPPPELRVPALLSREMGKDCGIKIAVGPHGSATPGPVAAKMQADLVVRGECEQVLCGLAGADLRDSVYPSGSSALRASCALASMDSLPPLLWPDAFIQRHLHHHHRFDAPPAGPGAELEASRGCPYSCTFCAKAYFRGPFRRRPVRTVLQELDTFLAQGVSYVYFIDELFLPDEDLLRSLQKRDILFGIQTRIDLWTHETLRLLGKAGCVSLEAGVESLTVSGRRRLNKRCRLGTEEMTRLLIAAKEQIAFVQANLIMTEHDDLDRIGKWRSRLHAQGVWANDPVPLFPYPGSPEYANMWGEPDDDAWERAHDHYLARFLSFSDLQEEVPLPFRELEPEVSNA